MIPLPVLEYVLTTGPYAGQMIGEAAELRCPDGTWYTQRMVEGIFHHCKGLDWMSWYLTHFCDWMTNSNRDAPDRNQIAAFLICWRACYNVEPYKTWAKEL